MKTYLLSLLTILLPFVANADAVEIDGIYYNLISKAKEAEVTRNPNYYMGSVDIPASITYEGVEYSVTLIGKYAFQSCKDMTSVILPNSVTSIGESSFRNCSGLTSIAIPNSVTTLGESSFKNCSGLTSVAIPNSVTTIGESSFENCSGLTSIAIPNSVTNVGDYAFGGCSSLTAVTISDIVAWCAIHFSNYSSNPLCYAHRIFLNGEEIKELLFPNNLTTIGSYAFVGCSNLTSITIPNSVNIIGISAFSGCSGINSVIIPNSVTSIGKFAFENCSNLTSVVISNNVTSINDGTFQNCSSLSSIIIPNSVTTIERQAFLKCNNMTQATIGNSVTSIGLSAFNGCTSLTSIVIPNSVTSIGIGAFYNCRELITITIGNALNNISSKAFASCPELNDLYCNAVNVPSTSSDAFQDSYTESATLHVPSRSVNAYKEKEPWKNFKEIVALEGETPETPKCATPTISYQNGQLFFESETEGVEFVTDITDDDVKRHYDSKISLTATYTINVYATKLGYDNSDVATATLCWIEQQPETEGIADGLAQIPARPVLIKTDSGVITVEGVDDQTNITLFTSDGKLAGSAISQNGSASIDTHLPSGTATIVKIDEKSVKVVVR